MPEQDLRLLLYIFGIILHSGLVVRLLMIPHRLAWAFASLSIGAIGSGCVLLGYNLAARQAIPQEFTGLFMTVNALVLPGSGLICLIILAIASWRQNNYASNHT